MSEPKLTYHERARKAAAARWGPRRRVRLTDLDPAVRAAIIALVDADEAAKRAASDKAA